MSHKLIEQWRLEGVAVSSSISEIDPGLPQTEQIPMADHKGTGKTDQPAKAVNPGEKSARC